MIAGRRDCNALKPWRGYRRTSQAKHNVIDSVLSDLPFWMRDDESWTARARQAARDAIDQAEDDAAADEIAAAPELAVRPLVTEFEHQQKIEGALIR